MLAIGGTGRRYLFSRGVPPARIAEVPNCADPEHFASPADAAPAGGPLRLLYEGTLAPWQGIETLLEALSDGGAAWVRSAVDAAEQVADGNLTALRVASGRDETGRVLGALAGMQQRLNALVRAIREGAGRVSQASEQLAAGNTELAARTEEQAASLEETAASIEELTASVKLSSDNAGRASGLASGNHASYLKRRIRSPSTPSYQPKLRA